MPRRDTRWRQGSIVAGLSAFADALGIAIGDCTHAIVISHDCDLQNDGETHVEIIVGRIVESPDGNVQYAKNPRRLHLEVSRTCFDNAAVAPSAREKTKERLERGWLELEQNQKRSVPAANFKEIVSPETRNWSINDQSKRELKQWLAARYARPEFPNAFEQHLRTAVGKKSTVEKEMLKVLARYANSIYAVFFDLTPENEELPVNQAYDLGISIVYTAETGFTARPQCELAAQELTKIFHSTFGFEGNAQGIALANCKALADSEIRLDFIRRTAQWRVEHLSFDSDEPEAILVAGQA